MFDTEVSFKMTISITSIIWPQYFSPQVFISPLVPKVCLKIRAEQQPQPYTQGLRVVIRNYNSKVDKPRYFVLNQAARAVRVLNGIQKNFCSNVSVYILSFRSKQPQYTYWLSTMFEDRTRNSGSPVGSFQPPKTLTLHGLWLPDGPEGFAPSPTRGETVNPLTVTVETGQILIPYASPSRHIQIRQFSYCIRGMRYCEAKNLLFQQPAETVSSLPSHFHRCIFNLFLMGKSR